jgi:hypothetical protein
MLRTSIIVTAALICGCYSGPNQLDYYPGVPALTVHVHFAELSAASTMRADLGIANYNEYSSQPQSELTPFATVSSATIANGDAQFTVFAAGGGDPNPNLNSLRFFRLAASLWTTEGTSAPDTWSPLGYDLVWSAEAITSYPLGPASESVSFPKGYSWLWRQCGPSPGQILMDVRPIDETVVFRPVDPLLPWNASYLEASERSFVESCGVVIPPQDLGTRISFDSTSSQAPVLSADGTRVYYVSQADPKDPTQSVSLRQVRLADGVTSEIVSVPLGGDLQQDNTGQLYVFSGRQLFRVTPTASGLATLVALAFPGYAVVSPDGQWFVRAGGSGQSALLWSVATGADVVVLGGLFVGWSPASQAAYISGTTLNVISPANPTPPTTYDIANDSPLTAWSSQGPVSVRLPGTSIIVGPGGSSGFDCTSCVGLSLRNLADGTLRQVLDASVGEISLVSTPPVLDTLLAWTQKTCLGLYNTVCSYSLIRIGLTSGTTQTVATAADQYPVGLSTDGQRIAFAAPSGIYIKNLSP